MNLNRINNLQEFKTFYNMVLTDEAIKSSFAVLCSMIDISEVIPSTILHFPIGNNRKIKEYSFMSEDILKKYSQYFNYYSKNEINILKDNSTIFFKYFIKGNDRISQFEGYEHFMACIDSLKKKTTLAVYIFHESDIEITLVNTEPFLATPKR